MPPSPVFTERQRFLKHWWPLLLVPVIVAVLPALILLSSGLPQNRQAPWLGLVLGGLVGVLFFSLRLDIRLDAQGVHYRMAPFHLTWRHRTWTEIRQAYGRTYDPLGEYGGWGLRGQWRGRSRALNVAGGEGIQLEFTDGSKLLLGTQRLAEAQRVLEQLGHYAPPKPV